MKKSFSKRIKITKTGKLIRRGMGIDHCRAHKSGNAIRAKRGPKTLMPAFQKIFSRYLTANN